MIALFLGMTYLLELKAKVGPFFYVFMALVGWPLISAILNSASRRAAIQRWEAWALKYPKLAFLLEVSRALGLDLNKLVDIMARYAARKAGHIPPDALIKMNLPPELRAALSDPKKVQKLVQFLSSTSPALPAATESTPADAPTSESR